MNLPKLIDFLNVKKKEVIDEFVCEDLTYDDDTVLSVELTFGEFDQILEIITAYNDATEDEDFDEDAD